MLDDGAAFFADWEDVATYRATRDARRAAVRSADERGPSSAALSSVAAAPPWGAAGSAPPSVLAGLLAELAAVAAQRPSELPESEALAQTRVLLGALEQLHTTVLTRIADVDQRRLYRSEGAGSAASWVAAQPTSLDRKHVALATRLGRSPAVADALRDARLSVDQARRVAAMVATLRRHVDRPDGLVDGQDGEQVVTAVVVDGVLDTVCEARAGLADDDPLLLGLHSTLSGIATSGMSQLARLEAGAVVLAENVEPGLLASGLSRLLDALLPNELERRAADGHEQRGFGMRLKSDGSGWTITDGELDLETGELLHTVITAEMATDPDSPADTAGFATLRDEGWQSGDPLPDEPTDEVGRPRPRSLRKQRHDALRHGLRRLLDSGALGLRDKAVPHLVVTVGADALDGHPGALPARGESGASLPISLVRRWSCDSQLTRMVLSLGRRVVEVSHTQRTLTGLERRIKRIETGGRCQGAGCHCGPGARVVPHHGEPWARTGTTRLDDTVFLCERTHQHLHVDGTPIRLKDGRLLGPDGWITDR